MEENYIKDISSISLALNKFIAFVQSINKKNNPNDDGSISFGDSNGFLGREEDYKSRVAEEAKKESRFKEWSKVMIGTGQIADYMSKAIYKASNLVYIHQKYYFSDFLNKNKDKAERVLYEIYRGNDDKAAFKMATELFGQKYDLIAFLFFIKDPTRFLPISPQNIDNAFKILNIDFTTSGKCSWDNYRQYLSIIQEIKSIMDGFNIPMKDNATIRLIDAHSFVWIINEKKFIEWKPTKEEKEEIEIATEKAVQLYAEGPNTQKVNRVKVYSHNAEVNKITKARAKGKCQLCGKDAPFNKKDGTPYLEAHHIIWLSRGGLDNTNNTAALCPNCHTKMHVVDDPKDVDYLKNLIEKLPLMVN